MEPRLARVEAHLEHVIVSMQEIRTDLRDLRTSVDQQLADTRKSFDQQFADSRKSFDQQFADSRKSFEQQLVEVRKTADQHLYLLLGAITGLAGLMAKGFHWF